MAYKKKSNFFETEEGRVFEQALRDMAKDINYATVSSYSTNSEQYPDNIIPFVDKHMEYIRNHPSTNPQSYLSNLRLMTKTRR